MTTSIDRGNCLAPRIAMAKPKSRTGGSAGALPPGDALGGERVEPPLESPGTPQTGSQSLLAAAAVSKEAVEINNMTVVEIKPKKSF